MNDKCDKVNYYTSAQIDSIKALLDVDIASKPDATITYTKADVDTIIDGVNTSINTKANQSTT